MKNLKNITLNIKKIYIESTVICINMLLKKIKKTKQYNGFKNLKT